MDENNIFNPDNEPEKTESPVNEPFGNSEENYREPVAENTENAEKAEETEIPRYENNEPVYSPYSNRYNDRSYMNSNPYEQSYTQPQPEAAPPKPKKKKKGFVAFIIALIAVIVCVAIVLLVVPKSSKKETAHSDEVSQIEINDSKAISSDESVSAQKIAEMSKEFNVGILLYGTSQSLFSNSSNGTNSLAGEGSGIIMSESGKYTYILTCAHVVSPVKSSGYTMTVQDCNGDKYDGELVGFDSKTDIGIIKIQATGLTKAEFGDSSKLRIGQKVYAIGNPGGTEFFGSFTDGMISSIDRPISSESGYEMKCIQHTTPINSGNSGGALMNEAGQVIGINSSKIVSTGYEGMAFSIPITDAKPIIDDILANGYVTNRPKLGIKYAAATQYQQYAMIVKLKDLPAGSLVIASIGSDSSLAKTDAQKGDLIIAVNGEKLTKPDVLLDKIENGKVGDELELTLCRISSDYSIKEFTVTAKLVEDTGTTTDEEQSTTQNYWEQFFGNGNNGGNPFGF